MAKLKTNALLAILVAMLLGISESGLKAAGASEYEGASESSMTSTAAALNQFDGRGLIDGVIMTSASANGVYVEFRDSDTANSSYESGHAPIAVVFFGTNTVTGGSIPTGNVFHFIRPIRVQRGLSTRASACASGTQGFCYSVLFRRVND